MPARQALYIPSQLPSLFCFAFYFVYYFWTGSVVDQIDLELPTSTYSLASTSLSGHWVNLQCILHSLMHNNEDIFMALEKSVSGGCTILFRREK